jgi:hypothetical protein
MIEGFIEDNYRDSLVANVDRFVVAGRTVLFGRMFINFWRQYYIIF